MSACVTRTGTRPPARRTLRRAAAFARVVTRAMASGERIADPEVLRASARSALDALGVRLETDGARLGVRAAPPAPGAPEPGTLVVANHISWLDVVALLAVEPVTVLAKREIAGWPVVGPVVRRAGTRFIDRDSLRSLPGTVGELAALLRTGRSVMVFPEGVTRCSGTGGRFRRAVFEAALDAGAPVRPVTVGYRQHGVPSTVAAFVGEDDFGASLRRVLAADGLTVRLRAHNPVLPVPGVDDRRSLAERAQRAVRAADPAGAGPRPVRERPRTVPRERAG
ncbi:MULTISPECIES: lysophospholipid acyltransferase family protein [Streptomyces]|nr:lysophospholipid acyltransferase family protein [Streptomyces lycii]